MEGTTGKIALDVALIPPPSVIDLAIRLNRLLTGPECNEIRLGNLDFIPHISLAMGCAGVKNLDYIRKQIAENSMITKPLDLMADGIFCTSNDSAATAMMKIPLTKALRTLHEDLMRRLEPFFGEIADESTFFGPVNGNAVLWVNEYRDKSSFKNFSPHITLGKGILDMEFNEVSFTAKKLSLCRLGNHCTCRTILDTWDLQAVL